jgi:PAS domain S-box-containing protein
MTKTPKSSLASEVVLFPHQPALQLIYETAPIGLACLSPDCRYLQINQRLTEICGISVEDHLGRFVRDCVPALADAVEGIVRSIMETGEPVIGVEVAGQRADQVEERSWITYWHPLRAPSGEIVAVNVAAEEITERKRAEQEVRRAKDAAETALRHLRDTQDSLIEAQKLAALGRLVAGVAHEVNSPVGISLTVASTLRRKVEQFAAEAAGSDLRRSTLNEFLNHIRDATAQSQSERRSYDPAELVEQVLSHHARELRERNITVNLQCEPGFVMDSYPGPFGQVLTNLAVNSIMHAFPGARKGSIDITLRAAGAGDIELLFADDGCGMAPEIRRQAFDPFFTTRRHLGATGLGLHTVYNIVSERLGGRLKLESEPGAGTRVQLILPQTAPRAQIDPPAKTG